MAEISAYNDLDSVIEQVKSDWFSGDQGHYFQLLNWGVRGLKKLKMTVLIDKKMAKVDVMDEPYAVIIPNDMVKFHAIGMPYKSKFVPFRESRRRITTTTEECGLETQGTDETVPSPPNTQYFHPHYSYTLDEQNNRILIDGYPKITTAVLIYQSTGVNTGKSTLVPAKAEEALIAWINLQKVIFMPNNNSRQKVLDVQLAQQRYQAEVNLLGKMQISIKNLYEIANEVFREKYYM
jgi:hypothetical protein